jgi:molecular chaperone HscB
MVQCPSCARLAQPCLVCPECGGPLAAETDGFTALGLSRKLVIDPAALERAYHALSRRIHPDRFASSTPAVRDASLRGTALLTRSYRTLRDPVTRGIYWLELNGEQLNQDNNRVPPELAAMVFEAQEQLAELRDARRGGAAQARELAADIAERRAALAGLIDQARGDLQRNFERWDAGGESERTALIGELKAILSRIAYLRTLMRDVDRELEEPSAVTL